MQKSKFKKRWLLRRALSFLIVLLLVFSLSSCKLLEFFERDVLSKDDISDGVKNEDKDYNTVAQYLYAWEFPTFNDQKFVAVENCVSQYYCGEMPTKREIATTCAEFFIEYFYDYIDLNDKNAVTDALLTCYMASFGDDYASYRNSEEYGDFSDQMSGTASFVGIGVRIKITDEGMPYIASVLNGSPAEAAGFKRGDVIVSVDGIMAADAGYDATVDAISGTAGTTVEIVIYRDGGLLTINPTRGSVGEVSVVYSVIEQSNYGYVEITTFNQKTAEEFKAAIDALEALGVEGIIFDLRSNLGGIMQIAVEMVAYLVDDGLPVVSYQCNGEPLTRLNAPSDGHKTDLPMVILVNEYTASAAEIFTAALRDYEEMAETGVNVTIVGKVTFGKGVMQRMYTLGDGSAITVTVAYYNPPLGKNYHGEGILPDTEIPHSITAEGGDVQFDAGISAMDALISSLSSN